jgi:hypothetical protein
MSVDYEFITMIGFKVPEDILYDRENGSHWSCEHAEEQHSQNPSAKHCTECGKKISEDDESWLALKPQYRELLGSERGSLGWDGELGQAEICFVEMQDMCVSGMYFVGVWISALGRDDMGAQRIDVPKIPSKTVMAKFLRQSGIPFDYDSWGLWKIGIAN